MSLWHTQVPFVGVDFVDFIVDFETIARETIARFMELPPKQKIFDLEQKSKPKFEAYIVHPQVMKDLLDDGGLIDVFDSVQSVEPVQEPKAKRIHSGRKKRDRVDRVGHQVTGLRVSRKERLACNRGKHRVSPSR